MASAQVRRGMPASARVTLAGCISLGCALISASVLVAAPGKQNASQKPILIGAAVALTGDEAPFDAPPIQAFQLAANDVNAHGGVLGRQLKVVVRDMKSDPSLAARVTTDLVQQGAELLIVPCDPDLGAPGAIVGQQKGILVFSECEASARFGPQGIGPLVYTPSHITYLEGYVMAEWAVMKRGMKHAFMIVDKTFAGYDGEVCKGFKNRMTGLAGSGGIVGTDTLSSQDTSIAATITRIKSAKPAPNFIFMCSQPPGSPGWIRQMRAAGINVPILLDTATDGEYWLKAVPHASNIFYPSPASIYGDDPDKRVNNFVKEFTKHQGHPPQTVYALFGAAIMDLWKRAVTEAKTTNAGAVQKKLDTFRNVSTIVGATTYTSTAHIALDRPMEILAITNGKIHYLETWKVKKAPSLTG
jgi:branched-chain amino acid transport system substrate-binding protein